MCRIMPIPHRKGTVLTVSTKTNRTVSLFTSGGRNYYAQGNHDAIAARLLSVEMVELLREPNRPSAGESTNLCKKLQNFEFRRDGLSTTWA